MDFGRYFATLWQWLRTWWVNTVENIGITDVIDMLIIAFLLYKLIGFLRKSRLGLVARSILLFLAIVWISGQLDLRVINFITSQAMSVGVLALLILFQQEIRQSLERLGRNNLPWLFGRGGAGQEMDAVINQTVTACLHMARERTGALLVFEREISLEDEVKTGTALDARLSAELLVNLFCDRAPLHDGAVIIRAGRLASAGCMLPLSDNTNLSRELGMRHRAGIGLSEKSDAVAVMVSEEAGSISVAVDGNLRRHLAQDTLENLLRKELITEDVPRVSIVSVFMNLLGGRKT
jgi:diadenylate cyclase